MTRDPGAMRRSAPFTPHPVRRTEVILACALFVLSLFLLTQGINEYFLNGHQGFNGALRSTIARNYVRHGYVGTGFLPMKNQGAKRPGEKWVVHWHHPPLIHMMVGFSFHLFGESEAATRAVPIFFTLLSLLLIYALVRRRYGPGPALLSGLVFTLSPMVIEYGKMANYEPPIIAFVLLALWFLDRIRYDGAGALAWVGVTGSLLLACFTDWPGFILTAFVGLDAVIRAPRKPRLFITIGVLSAMLLLGLWLWLNAWSEHDGLRGLARYRAGLGSIKVTFPMLFDRTAARIGDYYGVIPALVALLFITWDLIRNFRVGPVIFTFAGATGLYFLTFKAGAFIHVFFLHYLTPAIAVAAGVGFFKGAAALKHGIARLPLERLMERSPRLGHLPSRTILLYVLISLTALFTLSAQGRIINKAKLVSYGERRAPGQGTPLPRAGRLDVALLGKMIRSMTREQDLVLVHSLSASSPQLRYYMDRKTIRSRSLGLLNSAALYLVPERVLSQNQIAQLVRAHPVIRTMGYLIVHLAKRGQRFTELTFRTYPSTWWWTFSHSLFYPPHRLVPDPKAARRYLKKLGVTKIKRSK